MNHRLSRRTLTAAAAGFSVGLVHRRLSGALAQEATPDQAIQPLGFVAMRLRTLYAPEFRAEVNQAVVDRLMPDVEQLDGFGGYLLGDVIDQPDQTVAIVVFEREEQFEGFGTVVNRFVGELDDKVDAAATRAWNGDLLMTGSPPRMGLGTPSADPMAGAGYMAIRVHTSFPGTDPREFVPLATAEFVPIVESIPGFKGYLWYPTEGGFVAITIYDSEASATESNDAALAWAAEHLTAYTDGNPLILNTDVVYADLPILER